MLIKKAKRPNFNMDYAQNIALDIYGISAKVTELASERDQNFHLIIDSDEQFVLKIANRLGFPWKMLMCWLTYLTGYYQMNYNAF